MKVRLGGAFRRWKYTHIIRNEGKNGHKLESAYEKVLDADKKNMELVRLKKVLHAGKIPGVHRDDLLDMKAVEV